MEKTYTGHSAVVRMLRAPPSNPIPGTIGQFDGSMPPIKMILLLIVMLDNTSNSTNTDAIWTILHRTARGFALFI